MRGPQSGAAGDGVSRRNFLRRGAIAGALTAPLVAPAAVVARQREHEVFKLHPDWNPAAYCNVDEGQRAGSCHGCHACHGHAMYKIFRDWASADRLRAHPHCHCIVVSGGTLPHGTWTALFGPVHRPKRDVVDKRHRWVQNKLSQRSAA